MRNTVFYLGNRISLEVPNVDKDVKRITEGVLKDIKIEAIRFPDGKLWVKK